MRAVIDLCVSHVEHVNGYDVCPKWVAPMTVITCTNGDQFIDYGENYLAWFARTGDVVSVEAWATEQEACTIGMWAALSQQ